MLIYFKYFSYVMVIKSKITAWNLISEFERDKEIKIRLSRMGFNFQATEKIVQFFDYHDPLIETILNSLEKGLN